MGLTIAFISSLVISSQTPKQDEPIPNETLAPSATPSTTPTLNPEPSPTQTPSQPPAKPVVLYPVHPRLGAKFGTITLTTLKQSWPIFEGTRDSELAKGVGHYVGSVLPGFRDNTILSGHRTTVFNDLGKLKRGDLVLVKTSAGTFTYKVRSFKIVMRSDRTVIMPTRTSVLTLTTCYPFNNLGATTKAFVVTADLVRSNLTIK